MKMGVYVGSFNPPHKGHIYIVNYLLNKEVVNKVLIIPTGNYWDKQNLVDLRDRINMLKCYENDKIIIDTVNNDYPYTYELMRKLRLDYPNDELYLIIGADNIISFDKWKNYQELLEYNIIIMNRDDIDIDEYIKKYPNGHFLIMRDFKVDISSTKIRDGLDEEYIDEPVLKYIKENNLYGMGRRK